MEGTPFEFRLAGPGDADELLRTLELAFEGYRAFAPDTWEPPPLDDHGVSERLADSAVWCQIASAAGEPAGHVALMPAAIHGGWPEPDPGLAHLWQMFVREPFWGSGLAATLHGAVIEEALRRGFARFRLFTPAGQGRARRFYERERWTLAAPPFFDEGFGMQIAEYRRPLVLT
jgi:GNAT superfamily N-acetyltransferase